ncbi:hypothetical protein [Bacteroides heparinolyticus]|uniref:hypothetical protein n=1 Tax=Prevotella heparinolytica TaxID=28113 RepID=UPI00359FB6DB
MLEQLVRQILVPLTWLLEPLFQYGSFFYDGWSLIHFWSGLMLFVILSVLKVRYRWWILLGMLVLWEVLEQGVIGNLFSLFPQLQDIDPDKDIEALFSRVFTERHVDTFNDIFVGMLGGWMVEGLFRWKWFRWNANGFAIVLTAVTVAFAAVGRYGWLHVLLCFCMGVAFLIVLRGVMEEKTLLKACGAIYMFYFPLWVVGYNLSASWQYSFFPAVAPLFFAGLYLLLRKLFGNFAQRCFSSPCVS